MNKLPRLRLSFIKSSTFHCLPKKGTALWVGASFLLLASLGCGVIGFVDNPAPLHGPAYWAAVTSTPIPTVTIFLGTTTPVLAPTDPPAELTTTPALTTVTATPIVPPETVTPAGFTATPFWVTTTPDVVTATPDGTPPVTTTPGLPLIGLTTPEPPPTAYYRVGSFYMHSDVYIGGPDNLVLRLTNHEVVPSPRQIGADYHYLTFQLRNNGPEAMIVPLADLLFIRRVRQGERLLTGRWTVQNEPLLYRNLPAYDSEPLPPATSRELIFGFVLPEGEVPEVGLITEWDRPVEGGLPIWFYLEADPLGPFVDADRPPPPTPILLDDWALPGSGSGSSGAGRWPTDGLVTRGFGCDEFYTGIDGAGFGCPPDRPWFHNGIDIANSPGTPIWAPVDGTIQFAGNNPNAPDCADIPGSQPPHQGLGNYQRLVGGDTVHYFGHLQSFTVSGGGVQSDQQVATMGSTGCSTGSHLHWILYIQGQLVDPRPWGRSGAKPLKER